MRNYSQAIQDFIREMHTTTMEKDWKPSANQMKFINKANEEGYVIRTYSGRGMFGRSCPGIVVDSPTDFSIGKGKTQLDNMGLSYIVYCQY